MKVEKSNIEEDSKEEDKDDEKVKQKVFHLK